MNCGLSPDTELVDQPFVTGKVAGMQIVQQPAALAYQLEQAATRMMIFRVRAQMRGELLMRADSSATCTSGDPLSLALRALAWTISRLRATERGIRSSYFSLSSFVSRPR